MRLLVFNSGSSSLKFALYEAPAHGGPVVRRWGGAFEDAPDGSGFLKLQAAAGLPAKSVRSPSEAADWVLEWLATDGVKDVGGLSDIVASVHRVVHGGERFRAPTRLGDAELAALEQLNELAPLHNPPALAVIAAVRARLGPKIPAIAVFDTAYYADLPEAAYSYAVPANWRTQHGVRRYGFHGIAHRYLCQTGRARLAGKRQAERVISLQLGRGCSVTATLGAQAIATSMGFTPLEGLVMGTRCGDIDPGAVLHVMERSGMSAAQMRQVLNQESGLLGLSGDSADMRTLLADAERGDQRAALATEVFCRRARHYVAAYLAELRGADLIVFGGGIGENSPLVRARILSGFEWAGARLAQAANQAAVGVAADIAAPESAIALQAIPVDEAEVIAAEAAALLRASG
jgi:acetate kinase